MGKPVDFFARHPHFIDHLAPVWKALGDRAGTFYVPDILIGHAGKRGIAATGLRPQYAGDPLSAYPPGGTPMVVAAYRDFEHAYSADPQRKLVLMEHGAGFSFDNGNPHYAGGRGLRTRAALLLVPNEYAAEKNRRATPEVPCVVVGCPKLDAWAERPAKPRADPPVIAISFHWHAHVAPETRSAFLRYKRILPELARKIRLIGHAHPRYWDTVKPVYDRWGIPAVKDFEDVVDQADCYVNDCSSTLYEFAVLDRPVVVLNIRAYRREVNLGLRFWEHADVGVNCDRPEDLEACIASALEDQEDQRERRREAVEAAYPFRGDSAQRAAAAIVDALVEPAPKTVRVELPAGQSAGALYVAFGAEAKHYCAESIASLRRFHPDLPVAVVSDETVAGADRMLLHPEKDLLAREYKTRLNQYTPWEHTLFLDADTRVLRDVSAGWRTLALGWDLCVALDLIETIGAAGHIRPEEIAATVRQIGTPHFLQFNTGVLFFRKNAAVDGFFDAWHAEWKAFRHYDQAAFVRALRRTPVKLWVLGRRWNRRDDPKYVLHLHHVADRSLLHA